MSRLAGRRPRRAVLVVGALAASAAVWSLVDVVADLTQTRPEQIRPGSRSEIVFQVSSRAGPAHEDAAARLLWGSCQDQLRGRREVVTGPVRTTGGDYRLVVSPALGTQSGRRLTGCLTDARVDFVLARLKVLRALPDGQAP